MNQSMEKIIYYTYKSIGDSSDEELYDVLNKIIRVKMLTCSLEFEPLSPLFLEVVMGNREVVKDLVEQGFDINETRKDGLTPLAAAVFVNDFFMVKELLENGADVNGTETFRPLIIASSRKDARMLNLLTQYDPDMNVVDSEGFNAFHHLFNTGYISNLKAPECLYLYFGNSSFEYALLSFNIRVEDIINCIRILSMNGCDVNYSNDVVINSKGKNFIIPVNPLSLALETQEGRVIDCLEECGTNMRAYEMTPYMIYAYQDDFNFLADIRDKNLSRWPNAMVEYTKYLGYLRKINSYNIEVVSVFDNDRYKRPKVIQKTSNSHNA